MKILGWFGVASMRLLLSLLPRLFVAASNEIQFYDLFSFELQLVRIIVVDFDLGRSFVKRIFVSFRFCSIFPFKCCRTKSRRCFPGFHFKRNVIVWPIQTLTFSVLLQRDVIFTLSISIPLFRQLASICVYLL